MSEPRFRSVPWILVGVFGTLWVTKGSSAPPTERISEETPILLKSIRELGRLQTAEMNLSDAFQFETSKRASELAARVPGVDQLVAVSTMNSVWVQANGTVTAGLDLKRASIYVDGESVHVKLPPLDIQRADVDLKLMNDRQGLFWKDREILLKATKVARKRFQNTAEEFKIRDVALEGAKATLSKLVAGITPKRLVLDQTSFKASGEIQFQER